MEFEFKPDIVEPMLLACLCEKWERGGAGLYSLRSPLMNPRQRPRRITTGARRTSTAGLHQMVDLQMNCSRFWMTVSDPSTNTSSQERLREL